VDAVTRAVEAEPVEATVAIVRLALALALPIDNRPSEVQSIDSALTNTTSVLSTAAQAVPVQRRGPQVRGLM
jgi:hypothetical protein